MIKRRSLIRFASRLRLLFVVSLVTLGLTGCPGTQIVANVPTVEDADDQQATCKVAKDPFNPLVVEWPGTAKVHLETASRHGLVAVAYAGCTMKILQECSIKGNYELEKTTPARDRIEISDNNELYAKLPLGAASLKAELSAGASLELDYIAVGQRVASAAPTDTDGECAGATHYVRTITVGAFRLDAKAKGKIGASVEVGTAGGGISRDENVRKLRSQGDVDGCVKDSDSDDCTAILQLGLAPLRILGSSKLASAGFGQGLAPISEVHQVTELGDVDKAGATSLKSANVEYLKLLQTAKRADREDKLSAKTKAKAWEAVASFEGTNPWKERARRRAEEWSIRFEQEERQAEALAKVKLSYLKDKKKLDELLQLDNDVVSAEEKATFKKEFAEVYGARSKELAMVGVYLNGERPEKDGTGDGSGKSSKIKEDPGGIAGFGKFSMEAELGLYFSNSLPVSIENGTGSSTATAYDLDDDGDPETVDGLPNDGNLHTGNFMIGVMLATPQLIPGGFGFYGSFRAIAPGSLIGESSTQTYLSAGGGLRWDANITERGTFTLGAGGGYAFNPGVEYFCISGSTTTCEPNTVEEFGVGGPEVDIFAGIGFNNKYFIAAFRTWFQAAFMSVNGDHPKLELENTTLLKGGLGGTIGLVL